MTALVTRMPPLATVRPAPAPRLAAAPVVASKRRLLMLIEDARVPVKPVSSVICSSASHVVTSSLAVLARATMLYVGPAPLAVANQVPASSVTVAKPAAPHMPKAELALVVVTPLVSSCGPLGRSICRVPVPAVRVRVVVLSTAFWPLPAWTLSLLGPPLARVIPRTVWLVAAVSLPTMVSVPPRRSRPAAVGSLAVLLAV